MSATTSLLLVLSLLWEVFLWVIRFSPLLKNQHFQIPIRSGKHVHVLTSSWALLGATWVNELPFTSFDQFFFFLQEVFENYIKILWPFSWVQQRDEVGDVTLIGVLIAPFTGT